MSEKPCGETPLFRYTWPGKDEAFICLNHAIGLKNVANALGLYLQLIPVTIEESETHKCSQMVKDGES